MKQEEIIFHFPLKLSESHFYSGKHRCLESTEIVN